MYSWKYLNGVISFSEDSTSEDGPKRGTVKNVNRKIKIATWKLKQNASLQILKRWKPRT